MALTARWNLTADDLCEDGGMSITAQNTNDPARSSDAHGLPPLGITGASGNVGGTVARVLAEAGIPMRLLANTPSRATRTSSTRRPRRGCATSSTCPS